MMYTKHYTSINADFGIINLWEIKAIFHDLVPQPFLEL